MTLTSQTWTEESVTVAGSMMSLLKGGTGDPLLILHRDVGNPGWLPFYEQLAKSFTVYTPSHPGFDKSERPNWMRSVRDVALVYQWLIKDLKLGSMPVIGLGFGGWIAAEMATMCHHNMKKLVLVGAMGLQPTQGEILDQFLYSGTEYAKMAFHDESKFEQLYGSEISVDQLEIWEINREMTTRIAWKPYMFNQTLPYFLGGVETPTLIIWGRKDRIVPLSCGQRYLDLLPNAKLEIIEDCGHFVEVEKPEELIDHITRFLAASD